MVFKGLVSAPRRYAEGFVEIASLSVEMLSLIASLFRSATMSRPEILTPLCVDLKNSPRIPFAFKSPSQYLFLDP